MNSGCFGKFIALLSALGGGVGVVALLTYFLGSPDQSTSSPYDSRNDSITLPDNPIENKRETQPQLGSSAAAFCSSQFPNRRDYQNCLKAAENCYPNSVIYESCILGEMGRRIIESP